MPPLHRTVSLEQVDDVTLPVSEDLHLDVAWADDRLLEEERSVAESGLGLPRRRVDSVGQLRRVGHLPHSPATTAGDRLDE